ncbi:afadin isoform X2 [Planococcus citri]|uniref:afadin isoform X2 n=1 Tax=Planococcus citri TaxID=170843 RepID=UPI0031F788A0
MKRTEAAVGVQRRPRKMNPEMAMVMKRNEEREALRSVIQQWNANRLDLFELSEPNENLEFHGVMRFYFQDSGQKVATKCIRVASDATAQDVVETLIEKFRPDMRMLSLPEYALFEIHENGEERKLAMDEKPLLVQLNWHKDDREGRFLLRRLDDKTNVAAATFQQDGSSFRRKLSKREKKQLKKQEKLNRIQSRGTANDENDAKVAEKLYSELPETSFTRSISNPEAVMRRRRQQILERKLQQFRSKDGGPDTGGTLKIYGESLCRDVPYKTLLLSIRDTAQQVVREMLNKYGLDKEDPHNYCLVQVNGMNEYSKENKDYHPNNVANNNNNNQEYILDDDECPLAILMNHQSSQGSIMFHVRRRPADYHPRKRKKKPQHKWNQHQSGSNELLEYRYEDGLDRLPLFLELNSDGTEICGGAAKRHRLHPNVTEVGCERNTSPTQSQYLQLLGPNILPRHCVIANTEGIVTVTPCSRDSETYVNGQRIYETTILRNGAIVKFGRIHCFRFLDPYFEERLRQRHDSLRSIHEYAYDRQSTKEETSSQTTLSMDRKSPRNVSLQHQHQQLHQLQQQQNITDPQLAHNFETTFDVDGNIETRSTSSQGNKEDSRSQRSVGSGSKDGNRIPGSSYQRSGTDAILPAVLEIREETEEALLNEIVSSLNPNVPSFKLAPAYCLYLMARYRASTHYRPELTPTERAHRLTLMLERVATLILNIIQEPYCDKEHYCDIKSLALWLANSSELLFFLQFDRHLFAFSKDARRILSDSVQISFRHLVKRIQKSELAAVMPHFFADKDDTSHESEDSPTVLGVLASAMALLRRYRVNVALTVQLFSHLFHYINVWAFNTLIASNTNYCSRLWGHRLKSRLAQIEAWAERQGLEISTDTHLARIVQAAHLLQAPKYSGEDLASLSSTCFLLNSLQLRTLLMKYQPAQDEPLLPKDLIENVVRVAESLADELARSDGREVKLEEDQELKLEFVLPIDSYSCEVVRGIPPGLIEFVAPLQSMGLCRLSTQSSSNGLWTVYMELPSAKGATMRSPSAMSNRSMGYLPGPQEPEIHVIKLHKSNNGMGLSIVAAKGAGQEKLGIYIKAVVKGGAADADGRLQAGDQLIKVDGQSLVGITQERAAEYLVRTGPIVTLEVAKQGAIYHGLATLLSQPSPVMTRVERPRPRSELFNEPFREMLPSSYSMINLHQNNSYMEPAFIHWDSSSPSEYRMGPTSTTTTAAMMPSPISTGVIGNGTSCKTIGGGGGRSIAGNQLNRMPRNKSGFQPRFGNFLLPEYALLRPKNACPEEDHQYSGDEEDDDDDNAAANSSKPPRGVLTADNYNARRNTTAGICSSYAPGAITTSSEPNTKLCLCEDVLQQQQPHPKDVPRRSLDWGYAEKGVFLDRSRTTAAARMSPRRSYSDPKPPSSSLTKRIVNDVTACCLGVVPESDASTCNDDVEPPSGRVDRSVMTEESSFRRSYSADATTTVRFRNSCPLVPPENELCECEKKIRSGTEPATKILYQNGTNTGSSGESMVVPVSEPPRTLPLEPAVKSSLPAEAIRDIVMMNEQYHQHNLKRLLSNFRSLGDIAPPAKDLVDLTRRSSSDMSLYQKSCSMIAECTKCGNKFDIRGKYFNGPAVETLTTTTTGSSSTSGTSSNDTDTSSDKESAPEMSDKDRKLTKEERENILKELEDIISGQFFNNVAGSRGAESKKTGASSFPSSMLHLDLNTLKDSDTSASEGSLHRSNFSSLTDSNDFRTGRVAELARHFSRLGEAGIIKAPGAEPKTKSVPNLAGFGVSYDDTKHHKPNRSSSMEDLDRKGVILTELNDDLDSNGQEDGRSRSRGNEPSIVKQESMLDKRRQSFARQNTVFCKMKSVDELESKNRQPRKLYRYASLADFRIPAGKSACKTTDDRKKVVSFDDLTVRRRQLQKEKRSSSESQEKKEFNLESFLAKNKPAYEENLKINYDKMTTAIRDYLANKELLLKRMKSNSIDQYNVKSCSLSNLNRTCVNFTTIREAENTRPAMKRDLKFGMSVDAIYFGDSAPLQEMDMAECDDFTFKSNLRRVYKGPYFKGRRFRRCRKLDSRRSFLMYPGENLNRFKLSEEMKKEVFNRNRCQSLDTGMEAAPRSQDVLRRSHKLWETDERERPSVSDIERTNQPSHSASNARPTNS